MRYRATHHTNHVLDTDFGEVEIQFPADMADYGGALVHREGDHLVVAYLSHDDDCQNPLEDWCSMGKVIGRGKYETRRHDESELFEALGLDRNGDPNYELVQDDLNEAWKEYIESITEDRWLEFFKELGVWDETWDGPDFNHAMNQWRDNLMDVDAFYEGDIKYAFMEANKYVDWAYDPSNNDVGLASMVFDFNVEKVTHDLWIKAREEGRIGDRDAVMLDVYDHSGLHWSISGGGMQCLWDTSRGAGVWVPDDEARKEIDRRAPVYGIAYIRQTNLIRGGKYQLMDRKSGMCIQVADDWGVLWDRAKELAALESEEDRAAWSGVGCAYAAEELAQQALDEYNAWLSGDCHGVIVEHFKDVAEPGDEPVWEQTDEDACWGYIGSDYAKDEMTSQFESAVKRLQNATVTSE